MGRPAQSTRNDVAQEHPASACDVNTCVNIETPPVMLHSDGRTGCTLLVRRRTNRGGGNKLRAPAEIAEPQPPPHPRQNVLQGAAELILFLKLDGL